MRATLSDVGIPQAAASYDAWGVPETPSIAPFGFTGELQQGSNVWLRARWYGAGRGSFGTRDPYAGDAQTPYSLMPYQYAYANPALWTDARGAVPCAGHDVETGPCIGGGGGQLPPLGPTKPKPGPPGTVPYEPRIPRPEDGGGTGPGALPPRNQPDVGGAGKAVSIGGVVMLLVGGAICLWEQLHADPAPQPQHPTPPQPSPTPDNHQFYFRDVGPYAIPGRDTTEIVADLGTYLSINGIRGQIGQLQSEQRFYNTHSWAVHRLMGRKFEAERTLNYAGQSLLVRANSTARDYDMEVTNYGTIRFIEVKWSNGPLPSSTINDVSRESRTHPSRTYLLESNNIDSTARIQLQQKGGIELP